MKEKLTSRKWIAAVIGVIYTISATMGTDLPVEEVVLTNAVLTIYIFVEGMVDIARMRFAK